MAAADDQPRSGVSRRDALRLLAASTTTVAAGSLIVSQPAFADSGSETCRFAFNGSPSVTVNMVNANGNNPDFLSITVSNVSGTCPCAAGQSPQLQYSYYVTIPDTGSGGTGWTDWNAVSVSSPSVLWRGKGSATISVGVRTTCPTGSDSATAVRCGYGTATFEVKNNDTLRDGFSLGTSNGNSAPAGLPSCDSAPFAAPQLQSRALTAGGAIVIQPGAGIAPTLDPNAIDEPSVDLGTPDSDTTTSSTTSTTTTTTDKPGNGSKPKPNDSTTTTTATTTTTTTSAPSTTAPPPTSTTPPSTSTTTSTTPPPGG